MVILSVLEDTEVGTGRQENQGKTREIYECCGKKKKKKDITGGEVR